MSEPKFRSPLPGHPASVPLLQAMNGLEAARRQLAHLTIRTTHGGVGRREAHPAIATIDKIEANLHDFLSQLAGELEAMNAATRATTEALGPDEAKARELAREILTSRRADQLVREATGEIDAPYFVSTGIGIDQ